MVDFDPRKEVRLCWTNIYVRTVKNIYVDSLMLLVLFRLTTEYTVKSPNNGFKIGVTALREEKRSEINRVSK